MNIYSARIAAASIKGAFLSLVFSLFIFSPLASATMVVDGSLSDWGVNPGAYDAAHPQNQWIPSTTGVTYISEDQNPAVDYLTPGYGGQKFDVEAIYFKREGDIAYFAVVAGFPVTGWTVGGKDYLAGDLAIDFGSNGSYEFGVGDTSHDHNIQQGDLYGNAKWKQPLEYTESGPWRLKSGNDLGAIDFDFDSTAYMANGHYVYEYGIPIALFGNYWSGVNPDFTIHWTMSCGNDALDLHVPAVHTPEPGTYMLLLLGICAFMLYRRFSITQLA